MLYVLDGKMLQKQMKVGEQRVLKQSNMSQNCVNFQFLHMRFLHNICAIGRHLNQKDIGHVIYVLDQFFDVNSIAMSIS